MSTPTIAEINKNVYVGKTMHLPRPSAADPGFAGFPDTLARQQSQWDQAKAWDDGNAKLRAERAAEIETKRLAEIEQRRAEARVDLEADVRRRFFAKQEATEHDWQRLKGQLIDQALLQAPDPVEQAKAEMRRSGVYNLI